VTCHRFGLRRPVAAFRLRWIQLTQAATGRSRQSADRSAHSKNQKGFCYSRWHWSPPRL